MATLHVRDLPESTMTQLKVRAARAGQSLQAYVRALLDLEAEMLTPAEASDRACEIAARSSVTTDDVVHALAQVHRDRQATMPDRA